MGALTAPRASGGVRLTSSPVALNATKILKRNEKPFMPNHAGLSLSWALIDDAGRDLAQVCLISPSMSAAGAEGDILEVQGATGEFAWHVWSTGRARIDVEVKS